MAPSRKNLDAQISAIVTEHLTALVTTIEQAVRQNLARDLRAYLSDGDLPNVAVAKAAPRKRRILPCIAPGCRKPSKGPRFHYLCEEHKNAPKKDYQAWRKAKD